MGASGASTFGERLRDHRRAAELTQEELAERAGLSRRTISDLERGLYLRPHLDTVRLLARALALEANDEAVFLAAARQSAHGSLSSQSASASRPTNLPDAPTSFVGRAKEVAAVVTLVQESDGRLVTLTGPGGTGKTRLALQVGNALLDRFQDGIFFVDLAALTDPSFVPSAIAKVLGVKEEGGTDLVETLIKTVREEHLLLVLDNFEHVLDACTVVAASLDGCRALHVLVTSRMPLHLSREQEYPVVPLAVPDVANLPTDLSRLSQYESVALFIARARAVKPHFEVTTANAPAVAEICVRLDGLPLAVELAAARIKLLHPSALLGRLDHRLTVLTGGARDRPSRQQTLRNTIDWSHSLLADQEQVLFARLSVFAGGWTFERAEAVCSFDTPLDLLEGMTSLLEKSLVRQEGEMPRFSMLETIREYAIEKLDEQGETEMIRERHADAVLAFADEAALRLRENNSVAWLDSMQEEHDNVRAALGWLVTKGDAERALRLTGAIWIFWYFRNVYAEGWRWLEAALALPAPYSAASRAMALRGASAMAHVRGDLEHSHQYGEESLALYREAGDDEGIAYMCLNQAIGHAGEEDVEGALKYLEEGEAIAQQLGNPGLIAQGLNIRGNILYQQGREDDGAQLWEQGVAILRKSGLTWNLAQTLGSLAIHHREHGDYHQAAHFLEEGLAAAERQGDQSDMAHLYSHRSTMLVYQGDLQGAKADLKMSLSIARSSGNEWAILNAIPNGILIAAAEGNAVRAAHILGAVEAGYERVGSFLSTQAREIIAQHVADARDGIGRRSWEVARREGRTMSLDDAVAYALGEDIDI